MLFSRITYALRRHKWKIALGLGSGYISNYAMDKFLVHQHRAVVYQAAAKRANSPMTHADEAKNKVLVVVDRSSAGGKAHMLYEEEVMPILNLAGFNVELYEYDPQITTLYQIAEELDTKNLHSIVLCGDDTSFHAFFKSYIHRTKSTKVPIGIVPMGKSLYDSFYAQRFHLEASLQKRVINATARIVTATPQKIDLPVLAVRVPNEASATADVSLDAVSLIPVVSHLSFGLSAVYFNAVEDKYSSYSRLGAQIRIFSSLIQKWPSDSALLSLPQFAYLKTTYRCNHTANIFLKDPAGNLTFHFGISPAFGSIFTSLKTIAEFTIAQPASKLNPPMALIYESPSSYLALRVFTMYKKLTMLGGIPLASIGNTFENIEAADISLSLGTPVNVDGINYPLGQFNFAIKKDALELLV